MNSYCLQEVERSGMPPSKEMLALLSQAEGETRGGPEMDCPPRTVQALLPVDQDRAREQDRNWLQVGLLSLGNS